MPDESCIHCGLPIVGGYVVDTKSGTVHEDCWNAINSASESDGRRSSSRPVAPTVDLMTNESDTEETEQNCLRQAEKSSQVGTIADVNNGDCQEVNSVFRAISEEILEPLGYSFDDQWTIVMLISLPITLGATELWIRVTRPRRSIPASV